MVGKLSSLASERSLANAYRLLHTFWFVALLVRAGTGATGEREDRREEHILSIREVVGGRVGTEAARPWLVFLAPLCDNLVQVDSALLGRVKRRSAAATEVVRRRALGIHAAGMSGRVASHPTLGAASLKVVDGAVSND